jgi:hypothetical protein
MRSKRWQKGMVLNILSNAWYTGAIRYADIEYTDLALQIIPVELWTKAESRRKTNSKHAPKNADYLLSRGRLECLCGGSTECVKGFWTPMAKV